MKRRADERDNCVPDTVKAGKVATKWADNLLQAIAASKTPPLARLLFALGIRHVGESTAKTLADCLGQLDWVRRAPAAALAALPDIGAVVADSIAGFFAEPGNQAEVDALLAAGVAPQQAAHPSTKLHGLFEPVTLLGKLAIPRLTERRAGQLLAQVADLHALAALSRAQVYRGTGPQAHPSEPTMRVKSTRSWSYRSVRGRSPPLRPDTFGVQGGAP